MHRPPAVVRGPVCTLLKWSGYANERHIIGQCGTLKRARSDATLRSFVDSDKNGPDPQHSPTRRKRRRTVLEADSLPHLLCTSHVQRLISEHAHTHSPFSSSREVVQARVQSHKGDSAIPSPTPASPNLTHTFSDVHTTSSSIQVVPFPEKAGPESFVSFEALPEPNSSQPHTAAHDPRTNRASGIYNSAACNGPSPTHSASSGLGASSESANAYSPELSSRPAAPEGETTRIEITFENLHQELLYSRDYESLIQEVAQRIMTSSRWLRSLNAYKEAVRRTRFYFGAGFRKNRFLDLMNLVVEEAPKCGLDVPYTHQLRYSRYYYDGSEWSPNKDSEEGSSESESRNSETPECKTSQRALLVYIMQAF
jgi:hypothetical protein